MKVGDLVRLSEAFSSAAAIQDWGFGLIVSDDIPGGNQVEVTWPQKPGPSSILLKSRVAVVNESR